MKKSYIVYAVITVIIFFVGFLIGIFGLFRENSEAVKNCRKFCEFIPNTEFSHLDSSNNCYCLQRERLYDTLLNKTLVYARIVNVGVITEVEVLPFIQQ